MNRGAQSCVVSVSPLCKGLLRLPLELSSLLASSAWSVALETTVCDSATLSPGEQRNWGVLGDLGKTTAVINPLTSPGLDVSTAQRPFCLAFLPDSPACGPEPIAEQAPEVANKFSLGEDNYIYR